MATTGRIAPRQEESEVLMGRVHKSFLPSFWPLSARRKPAARVSTAAVLTAINALLVAVAAVVAGWFVGSAIAVVALLAACSCAWPRTPRLQITGETNRKESPRRFAKDPLTGLFGKDALKHAFQAKSATLAPGKRLALIAFDVDRLKDVNSFHGYTVGDQLLRVVALRLEGKSNDSTFRTSGDRFAVLVEGLSDAVAAELCAVQKLDRITRPLQLSTHGTGEVMPSASVGVAVYPDHGGDLDALLRYAEMAVDEAKRAGGRRCKLFDDGLILALKAKKGLEHELKLAIEGRGLALHYQPQIDLVSGRITAVEALMRWPHPERGQIPPTTFIPIAEATGLIRPMGKWLIEEAARQTKAWHAMGLPIGMAINISAAQLRQAELLDHMAAALATTGLPARIFELEVTESLFVDPSELMMRRTLQQLDEMGFSLAIDDFGTGYSSLAYLKRLPVHKIKIDKSFTSGIGDDTDEALVRVIISLARTFGKQVLAEGVETEAQHHFLASEGCNAAQGYLFAKPMPANLCQELLLREHRRPHALRARAG